MKCSLGISNFLEEILSLSHSVVFLYFFALITEGFLISPWYSLKLCIQMGISFLFTLAFASLLFTAFSSFQFSSVAQLCPTLWDPMNCSTPGLPVHHQLPELTQTQHPSGQWCHPAISSWIVPFSSCPQSLPASESFPMSQLFAWGGQSTGASASSTFQRNPRVDLFQNGLVGSPCSPRDSQASSPTPQFKSINSSVLSLLHSLTLTSIHDHRKNHSCD